MTKWLHFLMLIVCFSFNASGQNALSFAGTSATVLTNQPAITGNASRTVEAWIKVPNPSSTTQQVIADMGSMTTGSRFTLNVINGQRLRIEIGGNGFNGTTDITDNNWHHVAVTYNPPNPSGQKAKLYVDGILESQKDFTVNMNTTASANIRVGSRNDGSGYFNGTIDEVRIWNVERTAAQILADKDQEYCSLPVANLIAYYKFNEGIAGGNNTALATVINSANSSYTGTLNGFTRTGNTSNFVQGVLASGNSFSTIAPTTCSSYTVPSNNHTYTSSGTYYDTLPNARGCDSIITIHLTITGTSPITGAASNITSSSALVTWNSVNGATGYEYAFSTSTTPPASGTVITDTFYNASGLTQGTKYYLHVRAHCGAANVGIWTTISFETAPECYAVTGLAISGITQTGASFNWDVDADATWYEYLVTHTPTSPNPPLGGSGTYKTNYVTTSLAPGSTYFFHVRKRCNNTLLSPWVTEQFTTLNGTTDVEGLSDQLFSISPNPTKGSIAITWPKERSSGEVRIMITDVFGKLIRTFSTGREKIDLGLGDQPSGMYFIRISTGGRIYVKQVIVSR